MKIDSVIAVGGSFKGLALPSYDNTLVPRQGALNYDGQNLRIGNGNDWDKVPVVIGDLFDFTSFTFTSAGTRGPTGPTDAALRSAYAGAAFLEEYFTSTGGIQHFTVPADGTYRITAQGSTYPQGSPGRVVATVSLKRGDVLNILCGQTPPLGVSHDRCGCGGTFVESANEGILVVAGAPGGWGQSQWQYARGQVTNVSTGGAVSGVARSYAGGGGGYSQDGFSIGAEIPGRSFKNGGQGGVGAAGSTMTRGGFGGGGAYQSSTGWRLAGGGGYAGGAGASPSTGSAELSTTGGTCFASPKAVDVSITVSRVLVLTQGTVTLELIAKD